METLIHKNVTAEANVSEYMENLEYRSLRYYKLNIIMCNYSETNMTRCEKINIIDAKYTYCPSFKF